MSKEFKEGFSKGLGLASGLMAIPITVLFLFISYSIAQDLFKSAFQSEEKKEYLNCKDKYRDRILEQDEARRFGFKVPPSLEKCKETTRDWKWQKKL